jgi:hypothetical protein
MAHPPENRDSLRDHPGAAGEDDSSLLLPGWSSLVILLSLFGIVSAVALYAILTGGTAAHLTQGTGGEQAFRPADFPDIDFDEPLLPAVVAAAHSDQTGVFNAPPPPFASEGIFPCSDCHAAIEVDMERRELGFHDEIELHHGPRDRWCFDCHDPDNRDTLRLVSGREVGFEQSYELCGQCHGTIYRDWREGIHGRRRGYWDGAKSYLLCPACHNPHEPAFQPLKPLPPPVRPGFLALPPGKIPSQGEPQP